MNQRVIYSVTIVLLIAMSSSPSSTVSATGGMIMDLLNAHPKKYSMLIQNLQTAGLADTLQKGPY